MSLRTQTTTIGPLTSTEDKINHDILMFFLSTFYEIINEFPISSTFEVNLFSLIWMVNKVTNISLGMLCGAWKVSFCKVTRIKRSTAYRPSVIYNNLWHMFRWCHIHMHWPPSQEIRKTVEFMRRQRPCLLRLSCQRVCHLALNRLRNRYRRLIGWSYWHFAVYHT